MQPLLENKAKTEVGMRHVTPLVEAYLCGHQGIVQLLLDCRANVNVISKFGTPLVAAILGESEECVAVILRDKRLKRHQQTEFGTALHHATYLGR